MTKMMLMIFFKLGCSPLAFLTTTNSYDIEIEIKFKESSRNLIIASPILQNFNNLSQHQFLSPLLPYTILSFWSYSCEQPSDPYPEHFSKCP